MFTLDVPWKIPLLPLFPTLCCQTWPICLIKEMWHKHTYSTNKNENFKKEGLSMWNYQLPNNTSLVKQLGQGVIIFWSSSCILWVNSNMFHLMSIISVSLTSQVLCFPTNSIFVLLVAKIGMSVLMQTSVANLFLGDGSFIFSPSRRSSKSFQHISSPFHLTSC